jgi:hypothetical protein
MDVTKVVEAVRIGLSRLLRYSYGGFLLIALVTVVNRAEAQTLWQALPWSLTVVTALVAGAGIYAIHRSGVIPLHHLGLCAVFKVFETWRPINRRLSPEESTSPTRWLGGKLKVRRWERIIAYTTIRRSDFFSDADKEKVDVAHAETGAVVLSFEGFLAAALYDLFYPGHALVTWPWLFAFAGACLVASYIGSFHQHAFECMEFRKREAAVRYRLQAFLDHESAAPHSTAAWAPEAVKRSRFD